MEDLPYDYQDDEEPPQLITYADLLFELYNFKAINENVLENLLSIAVSNDPLELSYEEKDAYDFISTNKLTNGCDAFILDDIINQPLEYNTIYNLITVYKQNKNPFTREEIKRILKVKIKYA